MIAIIAKNGMLGSDVENYCQTQGLEYVSFDRSQFDICCAEDYKKLIDNGVDIVINCSAYTNVDLAESDVENANQINNLAVANLANFINENNMKLVHVSTDYVFDGKAIVPYLESDSCNPQTIYGKTKLDGEKAIIASGCKYLILRTSWLFGTNGNNFVKTMIKLSNQPAIKVVDDQCGSPTYTVDLVKAMFALINKQEEGIYHVSNRGMCTWNTFAKQIMSQINSKTIVEKCNSEQYPTVATRPSYSVMDTNKLNQIFEMPSWEDALKRYLEEDL